MLAAYVDSGRPQVVRAAQCIHECNASLLGVYAMYAPCILHTRCVFTFACDTLLTVVSRVLLYAILVTDVRARASSRNRQRPSARITRQKLCFTWQSMLIVHLFQLVHVYDNGGAFCGGSARQPGRHGRVGASHSELACYHSTSNDC